VDHPTVGPYPTSEETYGDEAYEVAEVENFSPLSLVEVKKVKVSYSVDPIGT